MKVEKKPTWLNVRIDPALKAKLQGLADKEQRSLSNYINILLKKDAGKNDELA